MPLPYFTLVHLVLQVRHELCMSCLAQGACIQTRSVSGGFPSSDVLITPGYVHIKVATYSDERAFLVH